MKTDSVDFVWKLLFHLIILMDKISQDPDAATFRYHIVNIFNPFDINENDNDIIKYHGDIDSHKY